MQFLLILGPLLALLGLAGSKSGKGGKDEPPAEQEPQQPVEPAQPAQPVDPDGEDVSEPSPDEADEVVRSPAIDIRITTQGNLPQDLIDAAFDAEALLEDLFMSAEDFGSQRVLNINLRQGDIDGEGNTAAETYVTGIRAGEPTSTATITFDRADLESMRDYGTMDEVMEHEMIHALGFGITWDTENLVGQDADGNPIFTGQAATSAFQDFTADEAVPRGVPLDGSRSHWDPDAISGDVMNAVIYNDAQISDITLASLADIGIPIDPDAYQDKDWNMMTEEEELLVA